MFVSDVFDFLFVGEVEPYFLSAVEEVHKKQVFNYIYYILFVKFYFILINLP